MKQDWGSDVRARILGDTCSRKRAENRLSVACSLLEEDRREEEWEMSDDLWTSCWMRSRNRNLSDQEEGRNALSVLKAFHDRCSGLWGLRRRNRVTVMPRYRKCSTPVRTGRRFVWKMARTGVVDDNGKPKIITDRCRRFAIPERSFWPLRAMMVRMLTST